MQGPKGQDDTPLTPDTARYETYWPQPTTMQLRHAALLAGYRGRCPWMGNMCGLHGCGVGVVTPGHGTNGVAMTMKGAIYPRNGRNFG